MKKIAVMFLTFLLIFCFTGCKNVPQIKNEASSVPDTASIKSTILEESTTAIPYPLHLYFSSGAGAWYSEIILESDGTFTGNYHDSDMGDNGENFPNGTIYVSDFTGKFTNIHKINNYTYSLTLDNVATEKEAGYTYFEDGVRFITCHPYGLMNTDETKPAKEFLLYLPDTEISKLSEDFLSWWPLRYTKENMNTLSVYGLYNKESETGFFTHPEN